MAQIHQNTRYCPACNKQLTYTRYDHCHAAERKDLSCRSCTGLGKRLSEKPKQKLLDSIRQNEVINLLKCRFIRIHHTDDINKILQKIK